MGQQTPDAPVITIDGQALADVESFKYLGSTIASNLSFDAVIDASIAKATGVMARLVKRVWHNDQLTNHTKLDVYGACVISVLTYACETWTLYAHQERRLNSFHLRCLRRILDISWEQHIPDTEVLRRAGTLSMHAILQQRRLRWLGHVHRMAPNRLPRAILYGELEQGTRLPGRPLLRYKDLCKRDLQDAAVDITQWEGQANDRNEWRQLIRQGIEAAEDRRIAHQKEKRRRRKESLHPASTFVCPECSRDCHSRIGLYSHNRKCGGDQNQRAAHRQP